MAWGDWVRTYQGALRRGAQGIVAGVLAAGGSVAAAVARLGELFERLPLAIANRLAWNVQRQSQAAMRRWTAAGNQPLPDWLHQQRADLPQGFRYNVLATFTDPRTGRQLKTTVVIDSSEALSWYELTARALQSINVIQRDRRARYERDPVANISRAPSFTLRAAYIRG